VRQYMHVSLGETLIDLILTNGVLLFGSRDASWTNRIVLVGIAIISLVTKCTEQLKQ
jgi:hypothetical protein